jgi:hypothetical protein
LLSHLQGDLLVQAADDLDDIVLKVLSPLQGSELQIDIHEAEENEFVQG